MIIGIINKCQIAYIQLLIGIKTTKSLKPLSPGLSASLIPGKKVMQCILRVNRINTNLKFTNLLVYNTESVRNVLNIILCMQLYLGILI